MGTSANSLGFFFEKTIFPNKKPTSDKSKGTLRHLASVADDINIEKPAECGEDKGKWKITLKIKNKHARKWLSKD